MYYFPPTQQTSRLKLPPLFLRFQTEESILRLIKVTLLMKTLLMNVTLRCKVTMDQVKTKDFALGTFDNL